MRKRKERAQRLEVLGRDGRHVHGARDDPARECSHHLLRRLVAGAIGGLSRRRAEVRRDHHVRIVEQRVLRGGLLAEHVQGRARHLAGVERGTQRLLVHQLAAGHVDHPHPVLHRGERVGVEPVLGLGGHGEVHGHEVGSRVQVVGGLGALHAELTEALLGHVGVEGHHAHAEAERPLCHELPDAAETEHAERLLVHLHAAELGAVPGAPGERPVRLRNLAREREQQRERVLGGGDHVGLRRVGHDHAALRGRVHVHVVHPHAGAADGLQPLGALEQVGVELGGRADQDPVELADAPLELLLAPVRADLDLEPGVAQQLDAGVADLLPDQDLHALTRGLRRPRRRRRAARPPRPRRARPRGQAPAASSRAPRP